MPVEGPNESIPYMQRTRNYYRALGYNNDYVWAHHSETPFTRPAKPLRDLRVALISTAGPADDSNRDERNRRQVWSGEVASNPRSFITDMAWDRESTHTDDRETFLPIDAVKRLVAEGFVGNLATRFHGAATDYSHQKTNETDAPEILRRLRDEKVDAALLTAL
ncbi:MAG: glycine/sarcosine/betaine reductase selenoprotein B family protein [Xanthobacteraceae bacterium]